MTKRLELWNYKNKKVWMVRNYSTPWMSDKAKQAYLGAVNSLGRDPSPAEHCTLFTNARLDFPAKERGRNVGYYYWKGNDLYFRFTSIYQNTQGRKYKPAVKKFLPENKWVTTNRDRKGKTSDARGWPTEFKEEFLKQWDHKVAAAVEKIFLKGA